MDTEALNKAVTLLREQDTGLLRRLSADSVMSHHATAVNNVALHAVVEGRWPADVPDRLRICAFTAQLLHAH